MHENSVLIASTSRKGSDESVHMCRPCADPETFARGGPTLQTCFFFLRGEMIQVPLKAGHHRSASETPFKWWFAGVPIMAQH